MSEEHEYDDYQHTSFVVSALACGATPMEPYIRMYEYIKYVHTRTCIRPELINYAYY